MKLRIAKLPLMFAAIGALLAQEGGAVFRSEVRLVEVYATVFDHKGRYLDGLSGSSFELRDEGVPQPIVSFESNLSNLSCGIVLDTTGSMFRALPGVKNAVVHLIEQFRAEDSIAIYSFSTSLQVLQDFTNDKSALKTAVLRTRAAGETRPVRFHLASGRRDCQAEREEGYDRFHRWRRQRQRVELQRGLVAREEAGHPDLYHRRGRGRYQRRLSKGLKEISQVTGGVPYTVKKPKDVETVFEDICEDLQHGYMLTYKPPPAKGFGWRKIELVLNGQKDTRIRARKVITGVDRVCVAASTRCARGAPGNAVEKPPVGQTIVFCGLPGLHHLWRPVRSCRKLPATQPARASQARPRGELIASKAAYEAAAGYEPAPRCQNYARSVSLSWPMAIAPSPALETTPVRKSRRAALALLIGGVLLFGLDALLFRTNMYPSLSRAKLIHRPA